MGMQTSSSLLLSTKVSAFRWVCKRVLAASLINSTFNFHLFKYSFYYQIYQPCKNIQKDKSTSVKLPTICNR